VTDENVFDFNGAARQDSVVGTPQLDAAEIRARINRSPRAFVDWLFSGRALCNAREARIGDTSGAAGSSLSIALAGENVGLWRDHATGESGDLIGLYMSYMGYQRGGFQLALKEIAKEFLGDPVDIRRANFQPTATQRIAEKKSKLGDKPRADDLELGLHVAEWKYYDLTGTIIAGVKRFEPDGTPASKTYRPYCFKTVDGQPKWMMGAPQLRPLYRLPEIALAQTVVLVEGEKCAQVLADLGIDATTAMQGAEAPIDRTDWSPLTGKTVIIWPDNDAPGLSYARRVSERLAAIGCTVLGVNIPADVPEKWDAADCVAEGRDPREIIATAGPVDVRPERGMRLYTLDELAERPTPEWLIDGMLTEGGLALLWAPPDSYKTFFAIDMAMSVATGTSFHGRATKPGLVIYVAAEDDAGVAFRMAGWRATRGKDLPTPHVRIQADGMTLVSEDTQKFIEAVLALPERPKLIVIDTVARTFGAGNENQTQDMNAYVKAADDIGRATGALVLIVHHSGLNSDRERGNTALRGACNTIISIAREGDTLTLINQAPKGKQKNAQPFSDIHMRMQQVHFTHRGEDVTTLVPMLDDTPTQKPSKPAEAKLGKNEKAVLDALTEVGDEIGFTRLKLMTSMNPASLMRALDSLCERDLARRADDGDGPNKLWKAVICS